MAEGAEDRRRAAATWWVWMAGAGGALVTAGGAVTATLLKPSVNPWTQSITLLGEGRDGGIARAGFVLGGLAVCVFAWGLGNVWPQALGFRRAEWVAGAGLALTGIFLQQGLAPVHQFRVASPWGYLTFVGVLHIIASLMLYTALAASALCAALALPPSRAWRRAKWYAGAAAAALTVSLPTFVLLAVVHGPAGLFERIGAGIGMAWQVWVAVRVVRRGPGGPATHGPASVGLFPPSA